MCYACSCFYPSVSLLFCNSKRALFSEGASSRLVPPRETSLVDCRSYRILMEQRCRSHSDSLFLRSLHSSWPGAYFCTLLRLGLSLDRFCPDVCHLWKSPIGAPTLLMYWATMIAIERISIYATNCKISDRFVRQRKRWSTP